MTYFGQKLAWRLYGDALATDAKAIEIVETKDGYHIPLRPTQHGSDDWDGDEQAASLGFWILDDGTLVPMLTRPFIPPHQII